MNLFKKYLNLFLIFFGSIGFEPLKLKYVSRYPKFYGDFRKYKSMKGVVAEIYPIVSDFTDNAGSASGHYFHQDLLVAEKIFIENPERHIDIGSRIDGFVAHIAAFRQIEIFDIRNLNVSNHENIKFVKKDLMKLDKDQFEITDSISCLHAIEHFGLGRYGDVIDPNGHVKGFESIFHMLKPGGNLYISFPISNFNKTYFNAHRVFNVSDIFNWSNVIQFLSLEQFDYVDDAGNLHINVDLENFNEILNFGCGIYTFKKCD